MKHRLWLAIAATPAMLLLTAGTPAAASARDSASTDVVQAASSTALPFAPTIKGAGGQASVSVTLPDGATPTRLTGVIKSSYAYDGSIVVTLNGRRVAEVPARTGGTVTAAASAEDVTSGVLVVGMFAQLAPQEDCFVDENAVATLTSASISYTHPVTAPTTIGGFLSPGLTDIAVQTGANPTPAEQEAALDAVAALSYRFRPPTLVHLSASDTPARSDFLHRTVAIREVQDESSTSPSGVGGTISLGPDGVLVVSAPPSDLPSTAIALADGALSLVEGTSLEHVSGTADWSPVTGPAPLARLGVDAISLTGVGQVQAVFGVGQPAFGRSLSGVDLDLRGGVTALPPLATGRIDVLWNGVLVASREMSDDAQVDIGFRIDTAQMNRDNTVTVILSYVPPSGSCSTPPLPARLDIDPKLSTVSPAFGDSVKPGFERFPQVLGSSIPIAIGPAGTLPELLGQAGDLVSALQSATPEQLTATVVPVANFEDSVPSGLMVGADAGVTRQLGAPYTVGDIVSVGGESAQFSAAFRGPLALAQAFATDSRNLVLVGPIPSEPSAPATAAAIDLTTRFTQTVVSSPLRWSALTGRVMAMGSTGQLDSISFPEPEETSPNGLRFVVIALIATVVILIGLIVWSRLRPKAAPLPVPGSTSSA